ncbi:MAG: hypothetical protein RR184_20060, partial [Citrobacter sp.]|uniref:hypothetical protein n=1 Tax=Citrobacter sp. TaxID=1896336 RepID=UPI002FC9F9AF
PCESRELPGIKQVKKPILPDGLFCVCIFCPVRPEYPFILPVNDTDFLFYCENISLDRDATVYLYL